jgi:hypothetical protein
MANGSSRFRGQDGGSSSGASSESVERNAIPLEWHELPCQVFRLFNCRADAEPAGLGA